MVGDGAENAARDAASFRVNTQVIDLSRHAEDCRATSARPSGSRTGTSEGGAEGGRLGRLRV
jgi:hypothetical protein